MTRMSRLHGRRHTGTASSRSSQSVVETNMATGGLTGGCRGTEEGLQPTLGGCHLGRLPEEIKFKLSLKEQAGDAVGNGCCMQVDVWE